MSAWTPFQHSVFRMLWLAWLTTNVCMWLHDVTAAWLMTSLTTSPVMVALVQTAATLPVFLLGVVSGALADILDRRRYFLVSQFWLAAVAVVACLAAVTNTLNAPLLLALTFFNGIGLAIRWPVFAAIIPELVPASQLPTTLALNGMAVSISRIVGPVIAGIVIATAGSAYVFFLNALLSIAAAAIILRWQRERKVSALPAERFVGAIRVGLQYVRQSPFIHAVLLRTTLFFVNAIVLIALLPLVVKRLPGGDARAFTLALAAMGVGSIAGAMGQARLRHMMTREQLVRNGTLACIGVTLAIALAPNLYIVMPAMLLAGIAWVTAADALTVAAQTALPNWVRARGMSIFHIAMMGGIALGAALWGQVATVTDVQTALVLAALASAVGLLATRRFGIGKHGDLDLSPSPLWKKPDVAVAFEPERGPILITIEYRIDPSRAAEFMTLMQEIRRSRLRSGVISWELFRDVAEPGRYVEYIVDQSWIEHLRRHDRLTTPDFILRERLKAFHLGDSAPVISRYIAESVTRV